jgi:hypothetical protein
VYIHRNCAEELSTNWGVSRVVRPELSGTVVGARSAVDKVAGDFNDGALGAGAYQGVLVGVSIYCKQNDRTRRIMHPLLLSASPQPAGYIGGGHLVTISKRQQEKNPRTA